MQCDLNCCRHSGAYKCLRRNCEDVCEDKVSGETSHCEGESGRVECDSSQDDGADQGVGEEANGVTEGRRNRVVEAQEAGQLVKGDGGNLAGENVDQILDDSAGVATAGRCGGGQGLDKGCGGARRWCCAWSRCGRRVRGRVSAKQAKAKEPTLRGCRDNAEKGKKA